MVRGVVQSNNVFIRTGTSLLSEEEDSNTNQQQNTFYDEIQAYLEMKQKQRAETLRRKLRIKKKAKRFFDRLFSQRTKETKKNQLTCL